MLVYVQAKLHNPGSQTNEWAVKQISEYVAYKSEDDGYARVPWVVSTCDDYTEDCKRRAKTKGVTLINGQEFARMLIRCWNRGTRYGILTTGVPSALRTHHDKTRNNPRAG